MTHFLTPYTTLHFTCVAVYLTGCQNMCYTRSPRRYCSTHLWLPTWHIFWHPTYNITVHMCDCMHNTCSDTLHHITLHNCDSLHERILTPCRNSISRTPQNVSKALGPTYSHIHPHIYIFTYIFTYSPPSRNITMHVPQHVSKKPVTHIFMYSHNHTHIHIFATCKFWHNRICIV